MVVDLSSEGHRLGYVDLDDPNWYRREYDTFAASILHAVALDRRLRDRGIHAFAVHPGMAATNLARHMSREGVIAVSGQARSRARGDFGIPVRDGYFLRGARRS